MPLAINETICVDCQSVRHTEDVFVCLLCGKAKCLRCMDKDMLDRDYEICCQCQMNGDVDNLLTALDKMKEYRDKYLLLKTELRSMQK